MKEKIKSIIKNNIFVLNYVKKASPWFITLTMLISLTAFVDTISNTRIFMISIHVL